MAKRDDRFVLESMKKIVKMEEEEETNLTYENLTIQTMKWEVKRGRVRGGEGNTNKKVKF